MILEQETVKSLGLAFTEAKQRSKIVCQCDYCGNIFERMKHNLQRSRRISDKDSCPDIVCVQKKRVDSNNIKFGEDNAFQNEDVKKKICDTNKEKYGVKNPFQNKAVQEKQKKTCLKRYGVENVFQSEDVKKRIKASHIRKYGVENVFQNNSVQEKQRKTLTEKYGFPHALQNNQLRKKAMDTCVANYGYFPANNYGKTQAAIQDWLNSFGNNFSSNRSLISGKEIDLYDKHKKLAIEYCGLHWHHEFSPEPRNNKYHVLKHQACADQNVQLITVFSDEWLNRNIQCKSHLKSILGIHNKKFHGRKCKVEEIEKETGREFFEKYHIQGKNKLGIVFYGLFHEQEIVGAMSLGRHNRQYDNLVLDRLCFKDGIQVAGGASKLFSRCVRWGKEREYKDILSFSDNRWSLGSIYEVLGFKLDKEMNSDYSYVDMKRPNKRISKQSQKKQNTNCPEGLTEYEWAYSRGLARIWDCGKKRWIYEL